MRPHGRRGPRLRPGRAEAAVPGQHLRARPRERHPLRHRGRRGEGRGGHDGRRLRRLQADRRPGQAGRAWRCRGRGVPVHGRRPAGRRPADQGHDVADRGPLAAAVRPAGHAGRDQLVQGVLDELRPRGRHRLARWLRDRHRTDRQGKAPAPAGRGDPDDLAGPADRRVQLQGRRVDSQVHALVPVRLRQPPDPRGDQGPGREEREMMAKVLVSGSAGFIGGYVVGELLDRGYEVVGLDNFSKYGKVAKSYDSDPRYRLVEGDARDIALLTGLLADCDHFIAGAAMIGGISYFHSYAYDLLATNERITAASCDAAIKAHAEGRLRKVTYLSSSMVFESADQWPSYEGQQREIPPPLSSYGFQKLAVEYFAQAAWDQYRLPFTIIRPFNCVGIGESMALGDEHIMSGNIQLAMSHVVPDLVHKVLKGQDPLHILGSGEQVRHYTYGGDLAAGIVTAMEHPDALGEDFNLSTGESTTVLQLAELIWRKIKGPGVPLRVVHDEPFAHDVQRRVPSTDKAKRMLGFEAATSLDQMLDEVIPWIARAVETGTI